MWVKNLVKLVLVLHFVALSSQSVENVREEVDLSELPSIWDDEAVTRMVRDVLAQDLVKEHEQKQLRRMHKRDIQSTATTIATTKASTTRKVSATTQKSKKPTRVSQTGSSKNKNRVTTASTTISTKATVKPNTKPIVTNSGSSGLNKINVNSIVANNNAANVNSSKAKVSEAMRNFLVTCSACLHVLRAHNTRQWIYGF